MVPCKACGAMITFAENPVTGRLLPLQKVTAYETDFVDDPEADGYRKKSIALKIEKDVYISHYLTCKNPGQFSKGKT